MEPSRFDDLTKALATSTSRRQALKAIAATTLGSILGLAGIGTAFAKCHNPGHNCEENSTCCSHLCCIAPGQREGVCCASGQTCSNGTCVTPTTTTTAPPTTTTTTTTSTTTTLPPQFVAACVCSNGTQFPTSGCTDAIECQTFIEHSSSCSTICGGLNGVLSFTCQPC